VGKKKQMIEARRWTSLDNVRFIGLQIEVFGGTLNVRRRTLCSLPESTVQPVTAQMGMFQTL